jgi:hypothetical protein
LAASKAVRRETRPSSFGSVVSAIELAIASVDAKGTPLRSRYSGIVVLDGSKRSRHRCSLSPVGVSNEHFEPELDIRRIVDRTDRRDDERVLALLERRGHPVGIFRLLLSLSWSVSGQKA